MSVERRAAAGAFWSFGATSAERAVGFAIFAIILHFVPVGDVGLVAIGSMLVELANTIAVAGVAERVIASKERDPRIEAGSFWAHFVTAGSLAALLWSLSHVAAHIYNEPRLVWVMRSLSAIILMNVLVVVPLATLTRDFRYRTVGLMSLASTIVGALAALPLALGGSGVLALVVQRLAGVGFFVLAVTLVTRWIPRVRVAPGDIVSALRFSLPLIGANLVDYLSRTGFALVAGLRLDVVSLGYLRVAQRLVEVLQEVVVTSISRIFLPLFVSIRDEPGRRYDVMLRIMNVMALLVVGCFAVAGAAARPLIDSMFGLHLQPAAPVFAVLSWLGPSIVVSAFVRPLLISCGRSEQMLLISSVNAVTTGIVAYLAVPFGLTVLGEALVARSLLAILFMAPFIRSALQHPVTPLLTTLILPTAAGITAYLVVMAAQTHLLPNHTSALLNLLVEVSLAATTYGIFLLAFARHRSRDMVLLLSRTVIRAGNRQQATGS